MVEIHIVCVCVSRLEEHPEFVVPDEVVLKVFKTTLNEFKNRDRYIKDDFRFKERYSKLNPRKIIRLWAEKEKYNLARCAAAAAPLLLPAGLWGSALHLPDSDDWRDLGVFSCCCCCAG